MLYRKLGTSDMEASVVALGTWAIGGWMWGGIDDEQAVKAIQASIDEGMNLIDTAPIYGFGHSECTVGKAIRDRRDQVVLATKCGMVWDKEKGDFFFYADEKGRAKEPGQKKVYKYLHPDSIRQEVEQSLRRLNTDYIDLYQTHWQESTTPIEETMAALLQLKKEGKIRAIGVSNARLEQIQAYCKVGPLDSDQERYSMLDQHIAADGILDHCRTNHIAVLAYSPLEQGLLTGKLTPERTFPPNDVRYNNPRYTVEKRREALAMLAEFKPIAERHHATFSQLAIAWTFSQPGLTHVLCGARDAKQAVENAKAGKITLSAADLAALNQIIARYNQ
ncbi:MAG: General stress protein 69 [Planctomycetes bacterium ADurb.Bin412]|nr:MAG: General stress protein 69 [Planctomycetes bacterium ADurb.Bin412]